MTAGLAQQVHSFKPHKSGTTCNSRHIFRKFSGLSCTAFCHSLISLNSLQNPSVTGEYNCSLLRHNRIPTSSNVSRMALMRNEISLQSENLIRIFILITIMIFFLPCPYFVTFKKSIITSRTLGGQNFRPLRFTIDHN